MVFEEGERRRSIVGLGFGGVGGFVEEGRFVLRVEVVMLRNSVDDASMWVSVCVGVFLCLEERIWEEGKELGMMRG